MTNEQVSYKTAAEAEQPSSPFKKRRFYEDRICPSGGSQSRQL